MIQGLGTCQASQVNWAQEQDFRHAKTLGNKVLRKTSRKTTFK